MSDEELAAAFDAINAKLATMSQALQSLSAQVGELVARERARAIDLASLKTRVERLELPKDRRGFESGHHGRE
jgi:hypothetical protein